MFAETHKCKRLILRGTGEFMEGFDGERVLKIDIYALENRMRDDKCV